MIDGLLRTALTGSAVTLAWTAANALHGKQLPALWHYRVLKLALLLFLVPVWPLAALAAEALTAPSPGLPVTTTGIAPAPQIPVTALPPAAVSPAAPMAEAAPAALSVDLIQILTAVWAVGAAAVLAYKLWVYLRFRRSFLGQNRPVSDPAAQAVFTDCKARLGIRRTVALQENPLVPTPLSTGLLRPVVVLPALPLSPEELRYLFLHELTHIKRHDLWMRFFSMLAAALHWYDPLVYLLNRQIRDFSEQSCDEQVSVPLDRDGRFAYGSVLLKLAADRAAAPCEWAVSLSARETIERRLMCVLHAEKLKGRRRLLAFALAAAILTCGTAAALAVRKPLVRQEDDTAQNSRIENAALRETLAERDAQKDAESAREAAVWFTPEDIRDIQSAELVWWDGTVYATLDDGAPAYLESLLDEGTEIASSGCPFHSILYLRRSDGVLGKILPAEDSCAVFQSGGVYYDFGPGDNGELYALFGVSTAKLPQYSGADIQTPAEAVAAPGDTAPSGGTAAPLYPDALRGDTALILSRGGTLLPDDSPSSYALSNSVDGTTFYCKQFIGKDGRRYMEYLVGNKEALLEKETRKRAEGAEERVEKMLSALVNGEYPKNKNGESYGIIGLADYVGYMPELYGVLNPDTGLSGYVRWTDEPGYELRKSGDISAYVAWREANPGPYQLPMYDANGDLIGYWEMGGSDDSVDTAGMTVEEAKKAVEEAGKEPLYPDAVRGDTGLILARGGTLLPDDDEASYTVMGGIPYKFFESKPRAGEKRGTVYFEYKVGNKELLDNYQLSLLDTLVNGEFPRNSSGSSYGFDALDEYVGYSPDLHRAGGTKGEIGYTKHSDIFAIPQYTADECPHEFTVPLYDSEENIIGAFPVSCGGHLDPAATGMTIDDAKTAIAGGAV